MNNDTAAINAFIKLSDMLKNSFNENINEFNKISERLQNILNIKPTPNSLNSNHDKNDQNLALSTLNLTEIVNNNFILSSILTFTNNMNATLAAIQANTIDLAKSKGIGYETLDRAQKFTSTISSGISIHEHLKKRSATYSSYSKSIPDKISSNLESFKTLLSSTNFTLNSILSKIGNAQMNLKNSLLSPSAKTTNDAPKNEKQSFVSRGLNVLNNNKTKKLMLGGALLGGATAFGALSSSSASTLGGADTSSAQSAVAKMLQLSERLKQNIFDRIPDCVKLMAGKTGSFLGKMGIDMQSVGMAMMAVDLVKPFASLSGGLGMAGKAFNVLKMAALSCPIIALITGIATAAYLIYDNWGSISEFFSNLFTNIGEIISKFVNSCTSWLSGIFDGPVGRLLGLSSKPQADEGPSIRDAGKAKQLSESASAVKALPQSATGQNMPQGLTQPLPQSLTNNPANNLPQVRTPNLPEAAQARQLQSEPASQRHTQTRTAGGAGDTVINVSMTPNVYISTELSEESASRLLEVLRKHAYELAAILQKELKLQKRWEIGYS